MCLSIPSKVVAIDQSSNSATVETMGVSRITSLELMGEEVKIGDYLLIHVGFAMQKIDEADALESIRLYEAILTQMDGAGIGSG